VILPLWVQDVIASLPEKYTGKIEINCVQGGVGNVQSGNIYWPPKEVKTFAGCSTASTPR
jgi:hypothetical protein